MVASQAGRLVPKLMSFDVFGTLIDVRAGSYAAFQSILADANAAHVDVKTFWEHWESATSRTTGSPTVAIATSANSPWPRRWSISPSRRRHV